MSDDGLNLMASIATPLDEWCQFCTTKLGVLKTADGYVACNDCATEVLAAIAKQKAEEEEMASLGPNRAQRRTMARATRRKGRGFTR